MFIEILHEIFFASFEEMVFGKRVGVLVSLSACIWGFSVLIRNGLLWFVAEFLSMLDGSVVDFAWDFGFVSFFAVYLCELGLSLKVESGTVAGK